MNVTIIYKFGIVLFITVLSSILIVIGIVRAMDRRGPMNKTAASPLTQELRQAPVGPLLQTDPVGDKRQILGEATAHLTSYGVVDPNPENTKAHVPIDIAMDLIAEGKLPYRQEPFSARLGDAPASPAATPGPAPGAGAPVELPGAPDAPATSVERPAAPAEQQQNIESIGAPAAGGAEGTGVAE